MGTWGAGIFSNDTACDVRGDYRLAHAQALAVIDQGRDLASWEGSDLDGYRRAVLRRLRQQLTSPSPSSKQVRPPRRPGPEAVRHRLPYQKGRLFQVPLRDGRSARGLVSRLDPSSGLIVAYCFGPAAQRPWIEQPAQVALKLPARPEHIARCPTSPCAGGGGRRSAGWMLPSGCPGPSRRTTSPRAWPASSAPTTRHRGAPRRPSWGDPPRFSSSRRAVRHTGMDVTVDSSDGKRTPGRLARQSPPVLRWALFEAAECAARPSSPDDAYYLQVKGRLGGDRLMRRGQLPRVSRRHTMLAGPELTSGRTLWDTPSIITSPGHGPADQDKAGRPRTPGIAPPPAAACSGVVTMH
jgi:hypothetical protein